MRRAASANSRAPSPQPEVYFYTSSRSALAEQIRISAVSVLPAASGIRDAEVSSRDRRAEPRAVVSRSTSRGAFTPGATRADQLIDSIAVPCVPASSFVVRSSSTTIDSDDIFPRVASIATDRSGGPAWSWRSCDVTPRHHTAASRRRASSCDNAGVTLVFIDTKVPSEAAVSQRSSTRLVLCTDRASPSLTRLPWSRRELGPVRTLAEILSSNAVA